MRIEDDIETGLTNFKTRLSQGGEDILTGLRSLGRNDDTESFLKIFKPDVSDDDVTTILGQPKGPAGDTNEFEVQPPPEEKWWERFMRNDPGEEAEKQQIISRLKSAFWNPEEQRYQFTELHGWVPIN